MFTLKATIRNEQGKGASRRLRHANKFPAIVYGGNEAAVSITLEHDEVMHKQALPEFYEVMTLEIDGKPTQVKVQAIQRHPFKPKVTHIDFVRA